MANKGNSETIRLPLVTDTHVNSFSLGAKTEIGSYIRNGVVLPYIDGTLYVTQRPTITTTDNPDNAIPAVTDNKGRGIFYWDQDGTGEYVTTDYSASGYTEESDTPAIYVVNNDEIYKDGYNNPISAGLTAGTKRVRVKEVGDNLVFLDSENNEMWYIRNAAANTVNPLQFVATTENMSFTAPATITTTSNPIPQMVVGDRFTISGTVSNDGTYTVVTHSGTTITVSESITTEGSVSTTLTPYGALPQNNGKTLTDGLVVLDQTMYVMDTDGQIWGSAVGNAQDWTDTLNFITAELEEDKGVFIAKHYSHIVAFGKRTIEFFYNAGNAQGSSLSVRKDTAYNIGCADPQSVWESADTIFFVGKTPGGQAQVYKLQKFELTPISNSSISTLLNDAPSSFIGSGFTAGGSTYYVLTTTKTVGGEVVAIETNVYNELAGVWTTWEHTSSSIDGFPFIAFTATGASTEGFGIFTNGDVFTINDDYDPVEDGTALNLKVRIDHFDNGNRNWKFAHQLRCVGDSTGSSATMTIKWADDNNKTYSSGRTIDIADSKNKLTRMGRFKSRSHEIDVTTTEQVRLEGLDLEFSEGTH